VGESTPPHALGTPQTFTPRFRGPAGWRPQRRSACCTGSSGPGDPEGSPCDGGVSDTPPRLARIPA
jgi:hypothetical protein